MKDIWTLSNAWAVTLLTVGYVAAVAAACLLVIVANYAEQTDRYRARQAQRGRL